MTIALSHGGTTANGSPEPSDELLVGTVEGVVVLQHEGGRWSPVGTTLPGHHIHALVFEPQSGLWFAGVYRNGVFASADGGRTWEPRNDGLTETSVFSLAVARRNGVVRLYAGTEPAHLFYSDNLGGRWTELPALRSAPSLPQWRFAAEPFEAHTKHLSVAPGDPDTLYVSVEVGGLHQSTDGGQTFNELPVPHLDVHRTVIDPRDPKRVYMVNGGAGLLASSDGGRTWEQLLEKQSQVGSYPDLLAYAPSNPDLMFLCASENGPRSWVDKRLPANAQIARSEDAGHSWTTLLPQRFEGSVEALCIEDTDTGVSLFAATTNGEVAWSSDGGDNWSVIAKLAPVSKSVHAEMMKGGGPTPLKFTDGELVINGVRVRA